MSQVAAERYVEAINRLLAGEPTGGLEREVLDAAIAGLQIDCKQRLGRLNRFADARAALERAGELTGEERKQVVRVLAARENRGAALSVCDEAMLALNAAQMLQLLTVEAQRRDSSLN